jgi:hypothetical protein
MHGVVCLVTVMCDFFLDFFESICEEQQGMNVRDSLLHRIGFVNDSLTNRAQEKAGSPSCGGRAGLGMIEKIRRR